MSLLIWPIRSSLLRYVGALPDGTISVGEGAQVDPDARLFAFPQEDTGEDTGGSAEGAQRFVGEVRLQAHGGMLAIRIARPVIETTDDGLLLTVAGSGDDRLPLALLTERDRSASAILYAAHLTEAGAALFGGFYPPGEELDPLEVRSS